MQSILAFLRRSNPFYLQMPCGTPNLEKINQLYLLLSLIMITNIIRKLVIFAQLQGPQRKHRHLGFHPKPMMRKTVHTRQKSFHQKLFYTILFVWFYVKNQKRRLHTHYLPKLIILPLPHKTRRNPNLFLRSRN